MAPHSLFAALSMTSKGKSKHSASLGSLAPIGSQKPFWPPRRGCHSLHSNYMLNRGYAYTTIISSKYHGQTLLSHLASLYPHSTPQAWQQKLNNGEVTLNGVTATGSQAVILGQTLVWYRPPWIEPDSPQHFEVLFEDPHLLAVNKPSGLPTLPGGGFMENTLLRWMQKQPQRKPCPPVGPSHHRHRSLRQNTPGGLETIRRLEHTQNSKNLPSAGSRHCTARRLRNSHTHRPRTAPAHRFCVGRQPNWQAFKVIGEGWSPAPQAPQHLR